ncbi:MAG: DNA repair protein RecN [Bacteroidales bacterium]|nr:DNA repair protein RecN [Bacteroidales bacterium]
MLRSLQIENYALIRSLNITFDEGFTVITGETGAGKSIMLGALSLILGSRADTSVLFDKSRKCFVEGRFDLSKLALQPFFEEHDIDYDEETILRREVNEKGKSRAFINDTPVTLQTLRELAVQLVDIHSQHHILLFNDDTFRIKVIDEYAGLTAQAMAYNQTLVEYHAASRQYNELVQRQQEDENERDFITYISDEIDNAHLYEGEKEDVEKQITLLDNAELIKGKLYTAARLLAEEEPNIIGQLKAVRKQYEELAQYNSEFADYATRIDKVIIELEDIAFDTSKKCDEIEVNPEKLEQLKERIDLIFFLLQKHHLNTIAELLAKMEEGRKRLQLMEDHQQQIAQMAEKKEKLYQQVMASAEKLSQQRQKAASRLEKEIVGKLHLLGMNDAVLHIDFNRLSQPAKSGLDEVKYLFSANRGATPNEIEKVASGGEISRLMLAIKSVISAANFLPTIIFDEIDTGISGETAGKVAAMMQDISQQRQLLVITHLPQVAAKGKLHYYIYKEIIDDNTYTNIRKLKEEEREQEIAKMMSGKQISAAALQAAKELIRA